MAKTDVAALRKNHSQELPTCNKVSKDLALILFNLLIVLPDTHEGINITTWFFFCSIASFAAVLDQSPVFE